MCEKWNFMWTFSHSWPPAVSNESNILCVTGYWLSANFVATLCAAMWCELFHRNWRLDELLNTWSRPLSRWGICDIYFWIMFSIIHLNFQYIKFLSYTGARSTGIFTSTWWRSECWRKLVKVKEVVVLNVEESLLKSKKWWSWAVVVTKSSKALSTSGSSNVKRTHKVLFRFFPFSYLGLFRIAEIGLFSFEHLDLQAGGHVYQGVAPSASM